MNLHNSRHLDLFALRARVQIKVLVAFGTSTAGRRPKVGHIYTSLMVLALAQRDASQDDLITINDGVL